MSKDKHQKQTYELIEHVRDPALAQRQLIVTHGRINILSMHVVEKVQNGTSYCVD